MILVIEGANKVGKTTFIERLKTLLGEDKIVNVYERQVDDEYLRNMVPEAFKLINYVAGMTGLRYIEKMHSMDPNKIYILDRFHLTENVYGRLKRGYSADITYDLLDKKLVELDARLLLMMSNFGHIDDLNEMQELLKIQTAFIDEYNFSRLKKMNVTTTGPFELEDNQNIIDILAALGRL